MHLVFQTHDQPGQVVALEVDRPTWLDLASSSIAFRSLRLNQFQYVGHSFSYRLRDRCRDPDSIKIGPSRRLVSLIARFMDSDTLSAYMTPDRRHSGPPDR